MKMKTKRNANLSSFFTTPISVIFAAEAGTVSSEPSLRAFHSRPQTVSSNQSKFKKSSNDLDDALKLFRQMAHTSPLLSVIEFNKLLCRIVKLKHYSAVVSLFQEMRIKGIPIDVYTINILVDVYCRSSRVDCGILVDALCKEGMLESAETIIQIMIQRNTYPNVVTYNHLIEGYCLQGRMNEARKAFGRVVESGLQPDIRTYNTLINGYCKIKEIEEARKAFGQMLESGLQPNVWAYSTLINGYCKIKEMDEARKVFGQMVESGLQPDVWTYNTLINGYCKIKEMDEAMHLFCEIPQKGLHPNVVTYTIMLQGFFLVRRCSAALELFQEMLVAGHKPDFCTSCVLLGGLCDNGLVEQAMSVYHQLDRNGNGSHDYDTIIIDRVCKIGRLNIARNVFNGLISKGRRLDVNTYNVMINGLCRGGFLDEALELLRKMEKNDCLPDTVTYNVILQEFVREKKCHEANLLLDEMVGKGISIDRCTFFFLNDLLALKTGDETVLKVIQQFAANHVK
nr:putative pentatricopeptide repeat-containing protein At1g12700, mitochondrial [Ipomoea trifida]